MVAVVVVVEGGMGDEIYFANQKLKKMENSENFKKAIFFTEKFHGKSKNSKTSKLFLQIFQESFALILKKLFTFSG